MLPRPFPLVVSGLLLTSCSGSPVETPSRTEQEIAAIEQQAPAATSPGPDAAVEPASHGPAAVEKLLSPEFEAAARTARRSLLALAEPAASDTDFDAAAAAARADVMSARSGVRGGYDRDAALVLTVLLAKQRELSLLQMLRRRNPSLAADPELEGVVRTCHQELRTWIEGSAADVAPLQRGGCLTLARESIAALTP